MKKVTSILFLLLLCFSAFSQDGNKTEQGSDVIKIYFDHNSHVINLDLKQNRESLMYLSNLIEKLKSDTLSVITKIEINSYTSPEGGCTYNKKLSENRSNAIYDYLIKTTSIHESLIDKNYSGTNWDMLQKLVEESDMQYRDEVLDILRNVPEESWQKLNPNDKWLTLVDSRNKRLMELKYGKPYRYMLANMFPQMRYASAVTIPCKQELSPELEEEVTVEEKVETEQVIEELAKPTFKPLLAVKTNLLYDAITALNVEVEVPIGQRWSVAGEWNFPWWTSCGNPSNNWQKGSKRNSFQLLQGNIEGKYWFGDRSARPVMTGWYAGVYGGAGKYDLERKAKGYQGEFYVVGLSGGYAHTILKRWIPNGNLRLEYSLGLGYMQTDYDKYNEHLGIDDKWHTIRQESGKQSWFGPTKAKVSLVWMFNHKVNKEK